MVADPGCRRYARSRTEKVLRRLPVAGVRGLTPLHAANGQTPFRDAAGFGLGTSWSRLIQASILRNRIAGLGKIAKPPCSRTVFAIAMV